MNIEILYWHWLIFGIVLILLEAVLVSFTVLWFGIGAIAVGILLWIFAGMSIGLQLLLWAFFSSLMAWLWFKYIKPLSIDKTKAGLSREAIVGQVGQVITLPVGNVRGKLRFTVPIVGSDEWSFICDDKLQIGDRVRVVDVAGNSLIVAKLIRQ